MIGSSVLPQRATILRAQDGPVDDYGTPTRVWAADPRPRPCALQPTTLVRASSEETVGSDAQSSAWQIVLPADVQLAGVDRVEVDGVTYEVDGPPLVVRTPRGPHHVEARLRWTR